jgi:hypothetical protein
MTDTTDGGFGRTSRAEGGVQSPTTLLPRRWGLYLGLCTGFRVWPRMAVLRSRRWSDAWPDS